MFPAAGPGKAGHFEEEDLLHRIVSRKPSPAIIISLVALFVALGGTSYAAIALAPKNSVNSASVINGSLQKADLSKKAVTALKGTRGARGPAGAAGAAGAAGPVGATGPAGAAGTNGAQGASGPRGPSDAVAVFKDGPTGINDTGTLVATLPSLTAGNWVIQAKAWADTVSGFQRAVTCVLAAQGDTDTMQTRLDTSAGVVTRAAFALQVVHKAIATFSVTLNCSNDGGGSVGVIRIHDLKITAIRVETLTNTAAT